VRPLGSACSIASECASNYCVDGVCCESACDSPCAVCSAKTGHCDGRAAKGTLPAAGHRPCSGSGVSATCAGACDGTSTDCAYPNVETLCEGTTCVATQLVPYKCNGAGLCLATTPTQCADQFACNAKGTACLAACVTNADCAPGAACDPTQGRCNPSGTRCLDSNTRLDSDGTARSCFPGVCVVAGCVYDCTEVNQCAFGATCLNNRCSPPGDGDQSIQQKSGCAAAPGPTPARVEWLAAAFFAMGWSRRRAGGRRRKLDV
jgi:hypothetical protein